MSNTGSAIKPQKEYTLELGDKPLIMRTGTFASQANATVLCQMGGTVSMGNITISDPREGVDFLPLQVVYQEKYYAGGKIAGSRFRKREGRPGDAYVLLARVIDRGLRPMFPKHMRNDIQVFCTVLSYDFESEHDITSANAANLAAALSDCPVDGPLGTVRVGLIGGELVLNPTREARTRSDLDMFVTASLDKVVMIEAGANQVPEAEILRAIEFGKKWAQKIAKFFADIQKEIGKTKFEVSPAYTHKEAAAFLKEWSLSTVTKAIKDPLAKLDRRRIFNEFIKGAAEKLQEKFGAPDDKNAELTELYAHAGDLMDKVIKSEVRRLILEEGIRMSSRNIDEIRPIGSMVDVLPNFVHGSALFQRGETQGLTTCTLGAPGDKQIVEGMEGEHKLRYMHHYNFPPFSVGETSNRLFVGNREIGHGNLAQRGIEPVLPKEEDFPYTIRTVTEILESNGSSSMAATCGSTLALMAAGVPISSPVSGIALGLISDEEKGKYVVLSDLQDEEDFGGDMDFKVTGTEKGVTAIQMDIKIKGLPDSVFKEALERSHTGRLEILKTMLAAIAEPRKELSPHAPRIETVQIDPEDIRLVIGKGGETIQKITGELGVEIDIEDSGLIFITSVDGGSMQKAKEWIEGIVAKPEVGKVYDCKVVRIIPGVGAIAEFLRGKDGMIHISELQWQRTENVEDVLKVGDEVKAKCVEYDPIDGKTRLSLKQMQERPEGFVDRPSNGPRRSPGGGGGFHRGGGRPPPRR
ncbi:polyribonucleotide nucleotidyltransferase [Candidatus Peregrinibacteria bacterium CG10_big_fil_rev_8_21_14_0_10_55_24]|nr:MAG: polyribonucleotide nucleotidyltransferase [Candidatus Peregrinibacteria bacterium CG10_big_fil_rev_8_21_14_0_10_55_24]